MTDISPEIDLALVRRRNQILRGSGVLFACGLLSVSLGTVLRGITFDDNDNGSSVLADDVSVKVCDVTPDARAVVPEGLELCREDNGVWGLYSAETRDVEQRLEVSVDAGRVCLSAYPDVGRQFEICETADGSGWDLIHSAIVT